MMQFIDTHSHLFLKEFDHDLDEVIQRARQSCIRAICLPNVDTSTIAPLMKLAQKYPGYCYPMMGLHPTSVKGNFKEELASIETQLKKHEFIAIGEIGIDLYWDKSYINEQHYVFKHQLDLALEYELPVVIHARKSYPEIFRVLEEYSNEPLKGVFHSFTGNREDIDRINKFGFLFGLGGIVTFKNAGLAENVSHIPVEKVIIETDSPYLSPIPKRGKRNESSHVVHVAEKLAGIYNMKLDEIARITTANAIQLFKIKL